MAYEILRTITKFSGVAFDYIDDNHNEIYNTLEDAKQAILQHRKSGYIKPLIIRNKNLSYDFYPPLY